MALVAIPLPGPVRARSFRVGSSAYADVGRIDLVLDAGDALVCDIVTVRGEVAVYRRGIKSGMVGSVGLSTKQTKLVSSLFLCDLSHLDCASRGADLSGQSRRVKDSSFDI